jgi:hypothetical protein
MDLLTAQGVSDKVVYILERKRLEHHLLDDQTGLANGPAKELQAAPLQVHCFSQIF